MPAKGQAKQIEWEVNDRGCHICTSHSMDRFGRPHIWRGGKLRIMSRVLWEEKIGEIPAGMFVCHSCDDPRCINILHLWLGTVTENNRDAWKKGNVKVPDQRGESGSAHKITKAQADKIRIDTRSCYEIGREFGICAQSVCNIRNGKTWKA